jgi:hypothetical protein
MATIVYSHYHLHHNRVLPHNMLRCNAIMLQCVATCYATHTLSQPCSAAGPGAASTFVSMPAAADWLACGSFTHVPVLVTDGGFGAAQCCYGRKSFADPPTVPWHRSCTQKCAHPRTGHHLVADPAPGMQLHLTHSGSAGCLAPLMRTVNLRRPHWTKRTRSETPRRPSRDEPAPM